MGNIHLQNALRLQKARLVAVADISRKALVKASNMGVRKTYNDYKELLKDAEVDAVIIALPTHLHLECARQAAEAGKDILLEKPLTRNVEEAKELISAVRSNSIKLMVGYPLKFFEPFRRLRKRMRNGEFGDIEVAYVTRIGPGPFTSRADTHSPIPVPDWWFSKELTGGGVLMDLGSHMINLARWYFGDITHIRSHLEYRFKLNVEDDAICLARFASGTRAIINVGWFSQAYQLRVELAGTVRFGEAQSPISNPLSNIVHYLARGTSESFWPYFNELQYFTNCLIYDRHPSPSAEDGLKDLEAISLAYNNQISLN
jgi:UDP-N-acetylglucosamine 3-dehydrogenase